ncbi:MAG: efflux RND transporter periplasmic adaptor subunit, partial [Acidobacteria bacterium]|nr:efflux RND transporter periplasmic adaptor subunit [Acidobacteriota bacterium]
MKAAKLIEAIRSRKIPRYLIAAGVFAALVAAAWFWEPVRERLKPLVMPPSQTGAVNGQNEVKATYYCPMHPTFTSDKPEECPVCTMLMVKREQPAAAERKILYYEDPMHPSYRSDKPGIAPDCGMKLVPVYAEDTAAPGTMAPGTVQISPARQQLMGVTTAPAEYRTLEKTLRTVGRVELDETRVVNVHLKITGWIQKVFVDYTFQHVKKGDPLFSIYSPDLLATEQEYLLALRAQRELGASSFREVAVGGSSLLAAARRRLSLWDLTDEQIRELEETGQPQREITFYSPVSGHVIERKAFP